MKLSSSFQKTKRAFSLVEVTIALGVAGFCLLAIFGLLPVGVNSNRISAEQSDAANTAIGVVADLRATPTTLTQSPRYKFTIPAPGGAASGTRPQVLYFTADGTPLGTVGGYNSAAGTPLYRVSVGFTPAATSRGATQARVMVTWPALSDRTLPATTWPVTFSGVFETVVALNRN